MGIKISSLPAIVTPDLTDVFPVVQAGVTYKETCTQLSTLFAVAGVNTNITSLTGLTGAIQAPTEIDDASGNRLLTFTSVASADTFINVTNNSGGNSPSLTAGGVTNVGLQIVASGTGINSIVSTNATPLYLTSGSTGHRTEFAFADTAVVRVVTFPDQAGDVYLSQKATGTEAANAVTASGTSGVITTSSLSTASGSSYTITWTNTFIDTSSIVMLSIMGGTNTKKSLELEATAGIGTSTITITNNNAAALDGTVIIGFIVIP